MEIRKYVKVNSAKWKKKANKTVSRKRDQYLLTLTFKPLTLSTRNQPKFFSNAFYFLEQPKTSGFNGKINQGDSQNNDHYENTPT